MSVIALQFLGRFGNCMFSYAFARAYAELYDLELQTDPWIGQKIFGLNDPPITATGLTPKNENDITSGDSNILFRSYCQQQDCLIYTKRDCLRWFKISKEFDFLLNTKSFPKNVAHRRLGDYVGYQFPTVSIKSYHEMAAKLGIEVTMLTEENPILVDGIAESMSFLPDFYCMMKASVLLRGNSTFSWWAATLNTSGVVYSPVIDGLGGGDHNVNFVLGNHPRLSHHSFCTDLHLKE